MASDVKVQLKGKEVHMSFPLGEGTPSQKGLTKTIATTHGNMRLDTPQGRIYVSVNAFQYPPR